MNAARNNVFIVLGWLVALAVCLHAQIPGSDAKATATVQGRVLAEGAPQAGVIVLLGTKPESAADAFTRKPAPTAVTEADGRYRFTQVVAGQYAVKVHAAVYVPDEREGKQVNVKEGETIENLDFNLRRGGVLTGKVVDAEGHPRIEERVEILRLNADGKATSARPAFGAVAGMSQTDDRGIFRVYGLEPGNYLIAAGRSEEQIAAMFQSQPAYQRTFYPSTIEEAEARPIEVQAGKETENIELVLARVKEEEKKGFAVSGRIFSAESGKPVAGTMVMLFPNGNAESATASTMPATSDGQGEFRFNTVAPGDYTVSLLNMQAMMLGTASPGYAEPLSFSVKQSDVSGLEIKLKTGGGITGSVVFDAKPDTQKDPELAAQLASLMIQAVATSDGENNAANAGAEIVNNSLAMAMVKPDFTFALSGLRPGKYTFNAASLMGKKMNVARLERNGVTVPAIELTGTESIANIRLVLVTGNASLHGRVQVQGGTLPAGTHFSVMATRQDETNPAGKTAFTETDARGQFAFNDLLPGTYELRVVSVRGDGASPFEYEKPTRVVTLTENAKQEVVLYLNLIKKENR